MQTAFCHVGGCPDGADFIPVRRLHACPPVVGDGATVIGFQNRPDLERTLGATSFMIDTTTGAIVESDIFFNTAFPWSVSATGGDRFVRSAVDCAARDRPSARVGALRHGGD